MILDGEGIGIPILEIEDVSAERRVQIYFYYYIVTGRVLDNLSWTFPNTVDKAGLLIRSLI